MLCYVLNRHFPSQGHDETHDEPEEEKLECGKVVIKVGEGNFRCLYQIW